MVPRGFQVPELDAETIDDLKARALRARGAVLTMTSVAASGHPGGSMSSMEIYLTLYHCADIRPSDPCWEGRDRVIVSHGHTSPGVYAALAGAGFFDMEDLVPHFRQAGSVFEGHVERSVPGVEWSTGNLGQGLSAGVGSALAARITGCGWHTFVAMSDGEQHKGQVAEARRLAAKEGLCDLTAVVDLNGVQISGHTRDVMPVAVAADFAADGWGVEEVDGHDLAVLYGAIARAVADRGRPHVVIAHTIIGKGVSFMEDQAEYHGRGLTAEEYARAMEELGLAPELERYRELRTSPCATRSVARPEPALATVTGTPRTYTAEKDTDDRSAWGQALLDIADSEPITPIAVLDCDLAVSVKTEAFAVARPDAFVECGVGEHNAATVAGAMSVNGVLTFWSDFGVFGIDEAYNQQRLNDINEAHLKLAVTHCGLDVGEDGKTHQCLDYVGAFRDFFGWRVVVPADPNQTDRAVRWMASQPGCIAIAMGRSKLPVIAGIDDAPAFAGEYVFRYGAVEWVRGGGDATVLVMGTPAGAAVRAADILQREGMRVSVGVVSSPLALGDEDMERALAAPLLVTVEDHSVRSGLAASVAEWLALHGRATDLVRIGVDGYRSSGASADLLASCHLDADGIARVLRGHASR
jgi:transketolase